MHTIAAQQLVPGPDGAENEVLTMLPPSMGYIIQALFMPMWADVGTGIAGTVLLVDKRQKGEETALPSYRTRGTCKHHVQV